jgi:transketolase
MTITSTIDLKKKANQLRNWIFEVSLKSGGHVASAFSCVEVITALYYGGFLNVDPQNPEWEDRDRFILSKGHGELALYTTLADLGFFPADWIDTRYRGGDCFLGGHPDRHIPGVEVISGSLGHGLGLAAGISMAAKMDGKTHRQYVLLGDSECTEGSIWEAAMFASKHELSHLTCIVDRNHMGVLTFTENFTGLDPFIDKWTSFGWDASAVNGHDFQEISDALALRSSDKSTKPRLIVAETIKAKGISFMENVPLCHVYGVSKDEEITQARQDLEWREHG